MEDIIKQFKELQNRVSELEKKQINSATLNNVILKNGVAPPTPSAGSIVIYSKTSDKKLYYKDENGMERIINTTP